MSVQTVTKPLKIGHARTCDCPPKHINCLTAKEWMLSQIAIWEFFYEKRDIRDKNVHPAAFPISLPTKCIKLFTHQGELVLDPFVGSGTTLVAAKDLNRNAVGFDLVADYVDQANARVSPDVTSSTQLAIQDDAMKVQEYLDNETVSLCVTSPPYATLLNRKRKNKSMRGDLRENEHYLEIQQYSNDPRDLGTMNVEKYSDTLGKIFSRILPFLKPRGHCVINIADYWWKGKRVPIHIKVIETLQKVGYELRNTIIWDRRNIVNKVGIFGWPSNFITLTTTFEYLLHFWKPE
jgi:DNA modification methylase